MKSLIIDLHEQLKSGKTTPAQLVANAKALADKYKFTNSIITPIFKASEVAFDKDNKEMVEELIAMAINEAFEQIDEAEAAINERLTGPPSGYGF